ncbi:MAG: DUF6056 family protein [Lachnospiraceae bacterium]
MKKWLLENEKRKVGVIIGIVFVVMYVLNVLTPMIADDYNYCFSFSSGVRITNLSEIVSSMNGHYYSMNGRIYAHTLAQIFLLMGMGIFDVLNTFAFIALGYCMYRMVLVHGEHKWSLLAILYTAMFMCIPAFGQTMLWLVGSSNYLWTTLTMLVFLLPYRYYLGVQFTFQFLYAFDSILTTFSWYYEREAYVAEQIAEGNTNIETFEITTDNRYSVFYNLEDVLGSTTSWTNESYSNYHGIDSIFSSEVKQD